MRISDWSSYVCSSDLLFIALQQRAKVLWQRPDMADVDMADVAALRPLAAHRLMDRPEGRSPAHDRQPAAGVAKANILLGHMVGDAVHLRLADVGHRLVVGGAIVEVAGADLLLDRKSTRLNSSH